MMNAVEVKSAYKYYGTRKDPQIIFNGLDMIVKKNNIYALIGSSGCGKTTLLSCILGEMYLNSGTVNVMGREPSEVPRLKIGYMPQEMNLADDLTLKQLVHFFGRIAGMKKNKIEERMKLLCELLDLDDGPKPIGEFSGGERRRVSLIIALLHEPELLILDEPTVGLDSILRYKVWNFLIDSTKKGHFTAIITTHYVQEASRADCIGLIRNGKILLEDCPSKILKSFKSDSLEEVHLKLSTKQDHEKSKDKPVLTLDTVGSRRKPNNHNSFKIRNIKALMIKNLIQMNGLFLYTFLVVLPFVQAFLLYHSFGNVAGMKITLVNDEVLGFEQCQNTSLRTTILQNETCTLNKISCRFIKHLNNSNLSYNILNNMDEVNDRITDAVVFFAPNYTESYTDLRENNFNTGDGSIDNSRIQVFLSNTNVFVNHLVKYALSQCTKDFFDELLVDCGMSLKLNVPPLHFEEPIFGSKVFSVREQMGYPLEMVILFISAGILSITSVLKDRLEGLWSRTLNAGVSENELLVAHLITQVFLTSIQLVFILLSIDHVFKLENHGENYIIVSLMFLTQFAGTSFGILISVVSRSFVAAKHFFNFIILSLVYLCDSVCTLESMPKKMQIILAALPFTIPSRAMINITLKGYGFENSYVFKSFVILSSWTFIFLALSLISLKVQKVR